MLKKLRGKFVIITMSIVTAMLLIIFSLLYHTTRMNLESQSISAVQTLAQSNHLPGSSQDQIRLPYFTLQISDRGLVVASGSSYYDLENQDFLQSIISEVYSHKESMGVLDAYDLRYCRVSALGGQKIAFVDISSQEATLSSLVQLSLLIGFVSLLAFLGVSFLLAKWAVRPVEDAWNKQKQFVSDASHELKTPLTVIMSNAELLRDPDCDGESRQQFSENILTMSHQMRDLVSGLLELARADNGQVKKSFTRLDLSGLAQDAVLPFEPVFFEKGLTLDSDIAPDIFLTGNEQYLRQVVEILLDNAGKYSDPGIVTLRLQRQGRSQCLLSVANPGTPIPQEDLQRIFERFYRADKARSRTGSFGLGLSIAQSVVQEHGGRIWAESNPTGNRFCVMLPCEPQ